MKGSENRRDPAWDESQDSLSPHHLLRGRDTCPTSACDCTALRLTRGNGGGLADGACVLGGGGARLIAEVAKVAHIQQGLLLSYNKQFRFRLCQHVLSHQDASAAPGEIWLKSSRP